MQTKTHSLIEIKMCRKCGLEKPITEYYLCSRTQKPRARCKKCYYHDSMAWQRAHRNPRKPPYNRVGNKNPNWRGGPASLVCEICGAIKLVTNHQMQNGAKYCSRNCKAQAQRQKTGELSGHWLGGPIKRPCHICGQDMLMCKAEATKNTKKCCSKECDAAWRSLNRRGANNHQWKGGITPARQAFYASDEWASARILVFDRDKKQCRRCGEKYNKKQPLHIHHIISFRDEILRADINNLVLLCYPCHRFVHSRKNIHKEFIGDR